MDSARIEELRGSLRRQLDDHAACAGDLLNAKLYWLSEQLENYIERWLGFLAITPGRRKVAPDDGLFILIELAAEMMTVELQELPGTAPAVQQWQSFLRVLKGVRTGRKSHAAEDVRSTFQEVRACLPGM